MMKATVKEIWLKALRSGTYEQTKSSLKDDNGFCCLGVLHDVTKGTWHTSKYGNICTGSRNRVHSDEEMLKGPFLQGLDYNQAKTLAEMNDEGQPFDVIADYIENTIEAK